MWHFIKQAVLRTCLFTNYALTDVIKVVFRLSKVKEVSWQVYKSILGTILILCLKKGGSSAPLEPPLRTALKTRAKLLKTSFEERTFLIIPFMPVHV